MTTPNNNAAEPMARRNFIHVDPIVQVQRHYRRGPVQKTSNSRRILPINATDVSVAQPRPLPSPATVPAVPDRLDFSPARHAPGPGNARRVASNAVRKVVREFGF